MFNEYAAKKGGMCIVDFMYDENKGWQSAGPTNCPTPFTWEVNPAEGPESKCEATICFNATYTEERCMSWGASGAPWVGWWWGEDSSLTRAPPHRSPKRIDPMVFLNTPT